MNTLLLLGIGIVLLGMGHRYWGRLLSVTVARPARAVTRPDSGLLATAHSAAASGGVLSLFGVSLALVWGWAPVLVWALAGCSLVGMLLFRTHDWLLRLTAQGADPVAATLDRRAAQLATVNWSLGATLLIPAVALLLADIVARHPETLLVLAVQAAVAALARGAGGTGGRRVATIAAMFLAAPLTVAVCARWSPGLPLVVVENPLAIALAALTLALVLQRFRGAGQASAFGAVVSCTLITALALAVLAFAVQRPAAGYPAYVPAAVHLPPFPLVVAVLFAGSLVLAPGVGLGRQSTPGPRPAGATAEGLFTVVVLAVLLAAPMVGVDPGPGLPDWNGGILPDAVVGHFIDALTGLAVFLPFQSGELALFAAAALAGSCWALMEHLVAHLRGSTMQRLPAHPSAPLAIDVVVLLSTGTLCAAYGSNGVPSWLWVVIGIIGMLHGASLLGQAVFANRRLKRPAWTLTLAAASIAVAAWWAAIDRAVTWTVDGAPWAALAAVAAVLAALPGQLLLWRHWRAVGRTRELAAAPAGNGDRNRHDDSRLKPLPQDRPGAGADL